MGNARRRGEQKCKLKRYATIFKPWLHLALLLVLVTIFISGCAPGGPDYTSPELEIPSSWTQAVDPVKIRDSDFQLEWWKIFNDPLLNHYIETARLNNLDVLTAIARIEETRARLGVVMGDRFPEASLKGEITRSRTSENSIGNSYEETFHSPSLGASWEIDLFGRFRRSIAASTAEYQVSEEEYNDVMISVYSQVSREYLGIWTVQTRLASASDEIP